MAQLDRAANPMYRREYASQVYFYAAQQMTTNALNHVVENHARRVELYFKLKVSKTSLNRFDRVHRNFMLLSFYPWHTFLPWHTPANVIIDSTML